MIHHDVQHHAVCVLQENVSCLNTTLVFLMFANKKNQLGKYLQALKVRVHSPVVTSSFPLTDPMMYFQYIAHSIFYTVFPQIIVINSLNSKIVTSLTCSFFHVKWKAYEISFETYKIFISCLFEINFSRNNLLWLIVQIQTLKTNMLMRLSHDC